MHRIYFCLSSCSSPFCFYFKLWRDFHIVARRCELCAILWYVCVCAVCVCCAGFRLAYAFCLLSVYTVHNVRIKLFSHYPVHSGFIKKFTMRCRSRFVGQPRTHSRAHTKSHTLKLLAHTHAHNVTDIAYHVSAIFQLLHRECPHSLTLRA